MIPAICLSFILLLLPLFLLKRRNSRRLPPGSLGFPFIGQSRSFLRAMRANAGEKWLQERGRKYGPVSKLTLFGTPTVFLHGLAANKFVYTWDESILSGNQPASIRRIFGENNLMELVGNDHKRIRGAILSFLKPDVLKLYVGKIDEEVKRHIELHWHGKNEVEVMPLMKSLTFDVISSLILGIERGTKRDILVDLCERLMEGVLSIPVNLPFTSFNRSIRARAKLKAMIIELISEKRTALRQEGASPHQDLITCLLSICGEYGSLALSDEEVVDNIIGVMIAGHDTTAILITFMVRLFANNPDVYAAVLHEQEEITKNKALGDLLTWDELAKMKYTWSVALETLRMTPPVFNTFRRVKKDIEYGGYLIPKGWQVFWAQSMTHMDEEIFKDPSKVDPKRFEKQSFVPPAYSFIPFGGGQRLCPGQEFARIETLTAIHYLVTQFEWKFCIMDNSFRRDPIPVFNQGLPIQIKPRKYII